VLHPFQWRSTFRLIFWLKVHENLARGHQLSILVPNGAIKTVPIDSTPLQEACLVPHFRHQIAWD
jgi:hypothetical protein